MASSFTNGPAILRGVLLAAATLVASSALADGAGERFLERLRELGHDDLVAAYLERVGNDPLATPEFQERARFEALVTRVDRAASLPDAERRRDALLGVAKAIDAARADAPASRRALADARGKLALALADDARRRALQAGASDRERKAARRALTAARERLTAVADAYSDERAELKGVQPSSPDGKRRRDLGGRLAQARLIATRLLMEEAKTHPAGAGKRQDFLTEAAAEFESLYQKYSKWVVGLYAHLYEGQCYRETGETALALGCFEALTSQPAATRELRTIVTLAHAETAALRVEQGKPETALGAPADWLDDLPANERSSPAGATLAYRVGAAALALANAEEEGSDERRRLLRRAEGWLTPASRSPSEAQADARAALAAVNAALGVDPTELADFEQAFLAGRDALAQLVAARAGVTDPSAGKRARAEARRAFASALELADDRTDLGQLNEARYRLAWLLWEDGEDREAAKWAGGVAQGFPNDPSAEAAAQLALAALDRLGRTSDDPRLAEVAAKRLDKLARFTAEKWSGKPAADAAVQVLLGRALAAGDLDAAKKLLDGVNDRQRPALALRFALARWERALAEAEGDRPPVLAALREAYADARDADADAALLASTTLYLAQAALDADDPTEALGLLDAPGHGSARLTELNPQTPPTPLEQQTVLALARAVAAAGESERCEAVIWRLDFAIARTDDGGRRLLLTLGSALRGDLASASARGGAANATQRRVIGATLDRIASTEGPSDWNTTLWIAQTRLALGEMAEGDAATEQLEAASEALAELLRRADSDPGFAPSPTAVLAARLQRGQCDRRLGRRREALEAFRKLLAERPAMLDVQIAAAETLQEWGAATGDADRLEDAIAGAYPGDDGRNLVWGWAKIAAVAGRSVGSRPQLRDTFFQAWLNVARSRYLVGTLLDGAGRAEQFRKAASTVRALRRQHPDLGGERLAAEFDALLDKAAPN